MNEKMILELKRNNEILQDIANDLEEKQKYFEDIKNFIYDFYIFTEKYDELTNKIMNDENINYKDELEHLNFYYFDNLVKTLNDISGRI